MFRLLINGAYVGEYLTAEDVWNRIGNQPGWPSWEVWHTTNPTLARDFIPF
jgi:hypothetical protein